MKKIFAISAMIVLLLFGINLQLEAGDLIVNGNIGVGTETPQQKVDVNGSVGVPRSDWEGLLFLGSGTRGLIWRSAYGSVALNSDSLIVGRDGNISEIRWDTNGDGAWAYCEGITDAATWINCADYTGTMTSNDYFWVFKNGHNAIPETKKDLKILFDGQSNNGIMGYMEDEDAFYFDKKLGIGTNTPSAKLDVNSSTGYNQLRLRTQYTPTGTSDTNGNVGDFAWDDDYLYVKTTVGWKRTPQLSAW